MVEELASNAEVGVPRFLQPTLRIFLSVDIVNSTAFKQSQRHQSEQTATDQSWFSPITAFYHGIGSRFGTKWNYFSSSMDAGDAPELWKAAGDELIYTKVLTSHKQALASVIAWIAAVDGHRKDLKGKHASLDLKAAAWLAGFPVNNAEVVLRRHHKVAESGQAEDGDAVLSNLILLDEYYQCGGTNSADMTRDFIGPSMDTGFRICSLASPRKFAVTADLAYMLAVASNPEKLAGNLQHSQELKFRYEGRVQLKGVDGGEPYPFFWIDMKAQEQLYRSEDDLLPKADIYPHKVSAFCAEYFMSHEKDSGHIMVPYINGSTDAPFNEIPPNHKTHLDGLIRKLNDYKRNAPNSPAVEPESSLKDDSSNAQQIDLDSETEAKVLEAIPSHLT